MSKHRGWAVASTLVSFAIACSDEPDGLDASDSGSVDSGVVADSGPAIDSGPADSGPADTGRNDAMITDAIVPDAMPVDSGPALDSGCVASSPAATSAYVALTPPGRPRTFHAAARLPRGSVLIAGGFSDGMNFTPDVEIYDPTDDMITVGMPRPSGQAFAEALPLPDGRVFVSSGPDLPALVYDQGTGWTQTATAPGAIAGSLIALPDGRVLSIGGYARGAETDEVLVYDPAADTWSLFLHLLEPRGGGAAVALADGRILVLGGDPLPTRNTSELIDVGAATSSPGPLMAEARLGPQVVLLLDRRVLVYGGEPIGGIGSELYDPVRDRFDPISSAPPPRTVGNALIRLCDGRVAHLGGRLGNAPSSDTTAWIFDPADNRWSATQARMPTRQSPSATLLLDGRVLVFGGGLLGSDPLPSAYVFVPDAP